MNPAGTAYQLDLLVHRPNPRELPPRLTEVQGLCRRPIWELLWSNPIFQQGATLVERGLFNHKQSMKKILHLCADTGSDTKPYRDNGYEVIMVGSKIGVENYHPPQDVYGVIANPVCTEFSTARSSGRARNPEKGMELVRECQRIISECNPTFWVIENPATGRLKDFLGQPTMTYEPWHYGSPWTKRTALWGKFNPPPKIFNKWENVSKIPGLYIRPGRSKPSLAFLHKSAFGLIPEFQGLPRPESDMEFRSLCSQNFAKAFFQANK